MKKKCVAIVLAAGAGKRMQSSVAKQYLLLQDKPVIWYALDTFERSAIIDEMILVVGKGEISYATEEIVKKYGFRKVTAVVEGGSQRYFSVWEALKTLEEPCAEKTCADANRAVSGLTGGETSYVFIHDGARPFVTEQILQDTYEAAVTHKACVTGMPVKDTIKIADEQEFAAQTPNRKDVWMVQTPQVFEQKLIYGAYRDLMEQLPALTARGVNVTDDAMVVETMTSTPVKLVQGSYENLKITTPEDMDIAEILLRRNKKA